MIKKLLGVLVIFVTIIIVVGLIVFGRSLSGRIDGGAIEKLEDAPRVTILSENLEIPWSIAFLPDGNMLVTERPGGIKIIDKNGRKKIILQLYDKVEHFGNAGLTGMVLHPDYENNKYVYIYYTYSSNKKIDLNKVVRFKFDGNTLTEDKVILDAIPAEDFHDGGRMKFGRDGFLYVTTGAPGKGDLAQDLNSLAGKILRMSDDGDPAPGNPFNNLVYSYGHRNPQGLAWDKDGRLWATEHGEKGLDELNLIHLGKNYGWPIISGDRKKDGMVQPIIHSGKDTWAPAGMAYINGSIFFGGLRGKALYEVLFNEIPVRLIPHFKNKFGRIRDVVVGPDKMLYISTSNRDVHGIPIDNDDRIIRIDPSKL